jgi:tyrosinase
MKPWWTFLLFASLVTSQCARIRSRKEWGSLSTAEKRTYISAVVAFQRGARSVYDEFASIHARLFNGGIHRNGHFLPWHRYFLILYENRLAQYQPSVAQHYWDATRNFQGMDGNSIFTDGDMGFGVLKQGCVSGPFAQYQPCITRTPPMNQMLSSPAVITSLMQPVRYADFRNALESTYHNQVHSNLGGDMATGGSPKDPLFFMHHCMVDYLWWVWQSRSADRVTGQNSYDRNPNEQLLNYPGVTAADTLNTRGPKMCYTYIHPSTPGAVGANTGGVPSNPGTPVVNPGRPVINPGTPVINPGRPVIIPGTPVVNPGRPVVNPGRPVVNPGFPVVNPGFIPGRPGFIPGRPGFTPGRPGFTPGRPGFGRPWLVKRGPVLSKRAYIPDPINDKKCIGEVIEQVYPAPISELWIKNGGYNRTEIRLFEEQQKRVVDKINELGGYVSPVAMVYNKEAMLRLFQIKSNVVADQPVTCRIYERKTKIPVGKTEQETIDNLLKVIQRAEKKDLRPTVEQLMKIIGKPFFPLDHPSNPFRACRDFEQYFKVKVDVNQNQQEIESEKEDKGGDSEGEKEDKGDSEGKEEKADTEDKGDTENEQ